MPQIVSRYLQEEAKRLAAELGISFSAALKSLGTLPNNEKEAREKRQEYLTWRRLRVRARWKLLLAEREYRKHPRSMYHIAVYKLQKLWIAYATHQIRQYDRPDPRSVYVKKIQRAWRSFRDYSVYKHLRSLLSFRSEGDPVTMLKAINPREAALIDAASGLRVRFRLGGAFFPPAIYYKIFTHAPVCDVGAFAPKDYTSGDAKPVDARAIHIRESPPRKSTRPPSRPRSPSIMSVLSMKSERTSDSRSEASFETASVGEGGGVKVGKKVFATKFSESTKRELGTASTRSSTGYARDVQSSTVPAFYSDGIDENGGVPVDDVPANWYRRFENNGWRPVSLKSLEDAAEDPVARSTAMSLPSTLPGGRYHYSTLKRRVNRDVERKKKKREWMMKMYKEGMAKSSSKTSSETKEQSSTWDSLHDADDPGWEAEADALLKWSEELDYDQYVADWASLGTSDAPRRPKEAAAPSNATLYSDTGDLYDEL